MGVLWFLIWGTLSPTPETVTSQVKSRPTQISFRKLTLKNCKEKVVRKNAREEGAAETSQAGALWQMVWRLQDETPNFRVPHMALGHRPQIGWLVSLDLYGPGAYHHMPQAFFLLFIPPLWLPLLERRGARWSALTYVISSTRIMKELRSEIQDNK